MTSRADVNRLSGAQRELVRLAQVDLSSFFRSLDLAGPERVRDALLEVVPFLVREYGELAATVAAEWYETVHPGVYLAQTATGVAEAQVQGSVRWAAGELFTDDPMKTAALLAGTVQRLVMIPGRRTIAQNVRRDPLRPRFARITDGNPCFFCRVMASRGYIYHSAATAGVTDDWHDDCGCQVIAEWDSDTHGIEGYDPDALYSEYLHARNIAGSSHLSDILAAGRREFDTN